MLSRDQIDSFEKNGFLNAGRVLDDGEVGELSAGLERIVERGTSGFAAGERQPLLLRDLPALRTGVERVDRPVWQIVNIGEVLHRVKELNNARKEEQCQK
jgi:hypothetical protein